MERLRDPEHGCPWDLRQNFHSIVPSTLEECYELAQAIAEEDHPHVEEELGDVLFQVIFYSQLGKEQGLFSFDSVISVLVEKLVRRHPHVFAQGDIEGIAPANSSIAEVNHSWEAIKQQERDSRKMSGLLADIPLTFPALTRAQKLQKRAAKVNFDWSSASGVLDKLEEEMQELREAINAGEQDAVTDELGDVFFTLVNLSRHLGADAESSLRGSSAKFQRRFECMEELLASEGRSFENLSEEQMDALWHRAKACQLDSSQDL